MNLVTVPVIRNEEDLNWVLARINELWGVPEGTPERDEIDVLMVLAYDYESEHIKFDPPTPQGQVRLMMDQRDLSQKDLVPIFGSASRVSEFLSGKRALSKDQAVRLHLEYRIPLEFLLNVYDLLRDDEAGVERPASGRATKKTAHKSAA